MRRLIVEKGSYLRIRHSGLRFEKSEVKLNSTESTKSRKVERRLSLKLELELIVTCVNSVDKKILSLPPYTSWMDEVRNSSNRTGFIMQA